MSRAMLLCCGIVYFGTFIYFMKIPHTWKYNIFLFWLERIEPASSWNLISYYIREKQLHTHWHSSNSRGIKMGDLLDMAQDWYHVTQADDQPWCLCDAGADCRAIPGFQPAAHARIPGKAVGTLSGARFRQISHRGHRKCHMKRIRLVIFI